MADDTGATEINIGGAPQTTTAEAQAYARKFLDRQLAGNAQGESAILGEMSQNNQRAIAALRQAQQVVVLSGAGMSAESGIPTFRDALTGLWARFRPEELASPAAFQRNPQPVWDWYAERRAGVATAQPNPGHMALVLDDRCRPMWERVAEAALA